MLSSPGLAQGKHFATFRRRMPTFSNSSTVSSLRSSETDVAVVARPPRNCIKHRPSTTNCCQGASSGYVLQLMQPPAHRELLSTTSLLQCLLQASQTANCVKARQHLSTFAHAFDLCFEPLLTVGVGSWASEAHLNQTACSQTRSKVRLDPSRLISCQNQLNTSSTMARGQHAASNLKPLRDQ